MEPNYFILTVNGKEWIKRDLNEEKDFETGPIMEKFLDWVLDDWEEEYPDVKNKSYVTIRIDIGNPDLFATNATQTYWKLWTRAKRLRYESTDGWGESYPVTDLPICIEAKTPEACILRYEDGSVFQIPFCPRNTPSTDWLYKDINHFTGLQVDYVGEIKIGETINWGLNGVNALLLFRRLCDENTCINMAGKEFVKLYSNPEIGYWFGELKPETVFSEQNRYYRKRDNSIVVDGEILWVKDPE